MDMSSHYKAIAEKFSLMKKMYAQQNPDWERTKAISTATRPPEPYVISPISV